MKSQGMAATVILWLKRVSTEISGESKENAREKMREQRQVAFWCRVMPQTSVKGQKQSENWQETCCSLWSGSGGLVWGCSSDPQSKDPQTRHKLVQSKHTGRGRLRKVENTVHFWPSRAQPAAFSYRYLPWPLKLAVRPTASQVISNMIQQQN